MKRLIASFACCLSAIPGALLAAPPEVTGTGGDGRVDIVALMRPPWWSHSELLVIIGILFTIVVGVTIWNRFPTYLHADAPADWPKKRLLMLARN